MIKLFVNAFAVIFLSIALNTAPVKASTNNFDTITSLQVAALFHKLIKETPDFYEWASFTNEYQEAGSYESDLILQEQEVKLRELYYNIFTDELFNIQTTISLDKYSEKQKKLFLPEMSHETFFSYNAFGKNYAVILPEISRYKTIDIDPEPINHIQELTGTNALMEIIFKVKAADDVEPMIIDGEPFWIILADIAQIKIWDANRHSVVWSKKAEWYSNTNEHLLDLYKK